MAPSLARRTVGWGAAILLSLGCAEIALRAFQRVHPTFILSDQSYNRFRGRPGALVFGTPLNSGGFKDVEHPRHKPAGTYRIVALGDSFAFGSVPYADNYLTLFGRRLGQGARPVEVINMGISGARRTPTRRSPRTRRGTRSSTSSRQASPRQHHHGCPGQ